MCDHESALKALEKIETRSILDDEGAESAKRQLTTEPESQPASKKVKICANLEEKEELDKRKLHKVLKRLSRTELEEMIGNKMIEVMTNKSEIGKLRQKVDSYEETIKKWKQRAQALSKQCTDLGTVMKKYITDSKNNPRERVAPVRITRSVGLQVDLPGEERRQQQQKQEQHKAQLVSAGVRRATRPASSKVVSSITNGAVRRVLSPAKTSVVRPALGVGRPGSGVIRQGVPIRHPSGLVAVPISSPVPAIAAIRKSGVTITPQSSPVSTVKAPAKKNVSDVVDLSDEEDPPAKSPLVKITPVKAVQPRLAPDGRAMTGVPRAVIRGLNPQAISHPAPLPILPRQLRQGMRGLPPRPALKIQRAPNEKNGIILTWSLSHNPAIHAEITAYQLYAYKETAARPDTSLWTRVGDGDMKAMPLPMTCTLRQLNRDCKYYFAVRAVDCHKRLGQFSEPHSILLSDQ